MFVIALAAEKFSLLRNNDAREKAIKSWKKIHTEKELLGLVSSPTVSYVELLRLLRGTGTTRDGALVLHFSVPHHRRIYVFLLLALLPETTSGDDGSSVVRSVSFAMSK
jgi:hypothetical protein